MPELAFEPKTAAILSAEAARLGAALADVLDALGDGHSETLADAIAFLRRMALIQGSPPAPSPDAPAQPLDRLASALGLSDLERDVVVLAGMPDEHEGYAGVLRRLHPNALPRPTAGLAAQLLCATGEDRHALRAALTSGPAIVCGLLRLGDDGPFSERTLTLADGIWSELAGADLETQQAPISAGLGDWLATVPVARAAGALAGVERVTVLVVAEVTQTATDRALAIVAASGRRALGGAPAAGDDEATTTLALRALARGSIPVITLAPRDPAAHGTSGALARHPGPIVLCGRPGDAVASHGERTLLMVRAEPLDARARRQMWSAVLPELADAAHKIAAHHAVEPTLAARVAADVRARAWLDGRPPTREDVTASTAVRSAGALPAGVTLRRPVAGFDRLVLAPDRLAQLQAAVDRLRHQALVLDEWGFLPDRPGARGVRMLLAGPPGTGKTLSAEVLAHALGVDLMVVDISRILSKWIGETEQRLAEVFDAAEPGHAVLLFDEADALFGKRTDISDAHDRYANLETAYLLQRLERFEGLGILTTNLRQNIDEAFTRRIEFVVEFDEPGQQEREALWIAHMPDGAPVAPDLDLGELAARYPLVGGLIRNAAVAAAFLAAADGTPIGREHALRAIEREYEKHGRAFPGRPPHTRRTDPDLSAARGTP
jgi:hypothetical protein